MGDILQFHPRQPGIIARLDASVICMHRLQVASDLPAEEMRVEALGARLDMASLREAMHSVLSAAASTPRSAGGVEHVWGRLEGLLDQVATCASCSYAERHAERSYAMRAQLKGACRSTLIELDNLRSLLAPANCAKN